MQMPRPYNFMMGIETRDGSAIRFECDRPDTRLDHFVTITKSGIPTLPWLSVANFPPGLS